MQRLESVRNALQISEPAALLLLVLSVLVGLLVMGLLVTMLRVIRLSRRIAQLTHGVEKGNMEQVLHSHLETVAQTERRMDLLEHATAVLQAQMPGCLQHARLVRYDAFPDIGGAQSFSLALLDARGNGVVVSSVYSRADIRVYAKSVSDGLASHPLSEEEEQAIQGVAAR